MTDTTTAWAGYCLPCNGPIIRKSRVRLALAWVAYWTWMVLPTRIALGWAGMKILPYAGEIAFGCHCRAKVVHGRMTSEEAAHADTPNAGGE